MLDMKYEEDIRIFGWIEFRHFFFFLLPIIFHFFFPEIIGDIADFSVT